MAEFGSAVITNDGADLLARVMAGGRQMEFTALTIGDGVYTQEEKAISALQAMSALKNQRLSFAFSSVAPYSETAVCLKAVVSNITVTSGFYINEVGIWAKDATDENADPILYSIVVANTADYLPAYNGSTPSTIEQDWYTTLSNTATATITVSSSAYALASDFTAFQANIADVEASAIASKAYEADDYLIYAGQFYRAITDIAQGDTLIVDSNIRATNIGHEISCIEAGSKIRMTFGEDFAGLGYTLTDGVESYSGTVPETAPFVVDQVVSDLNTTFTVSAEVEGTTYSNSVAVGQFYGLYEMELRTFSATLNVTVVNGTGSTIVATDGTHTYAAVESSGAATIPIYAAGTYTISAELSGETGALTDSVVISTAGTTYTAKAGFASTTLNDNDWDVISAVSAAGLGDALWDIGDCKAVEINGTVGTLAVNDTYYAYIIGFNHNSEAEGEGITFQGFKTAAENGVSIALCDSYYGQYQKYDGTKYFQMNHWGDSSNYNTNYGGWPACDMRYDILGSTDQAPSPYGSVKTTGATGTDPSDTCATSPKANTLMAALPAALRAVMKPITKVTDGVGNSSDIEANLRTTKDYLPLLAEFEIFGARTYANQYEQNHQKQYDYYKNGNPKIKYNHSATTTAVGWWERSANYNTATTFCIVDTDGDANDNTASHSRGLAPAFLI